MQYFVLHCIIEHCIVLHYFVLQCIIEHCIIEQFSMGTAWSLSARVNIFFQWPKTRVQWPKNRLNIESDSLI